MKLRANRKYVIAAKAQRRVFDSTEQYYWLIWISVDGDQGKPVMLTNNNLMGEDSPDAVFKLKELIPTGLTQHQQPYLRHVGKTVSVLNGNRCGQAHISAITTGCDPRKMLVNGVTT